MSTPIPIFYSFRRCPYAMRARLALHFAQCTVELREILLKHKPQVMLEVSPKGTVPVLVLDSGEVLEESLDIMLWALAQHDPHAMLRHGDSALAWVQRNDEEFKFHLDRYKYSDRYLENEKKIESPYMTVGFGTTLEGRNALKAALHQADNTVRVQIINRVHNAVLYDFIDDYSNKTGYGCMLNTSFNLHGFPIVSNQEDAYYVFNNSSLDCLWFDEWLIMR